jgi:hypothetical protein
MTVKPCSLNSNQLAVLHEFFYARPGDPKMPERIDPFQLLALNQPVNGFRANL